MKPKVTNTLSISKKMNQHTPNSFQEKEKFAQKDDLFTSNQRMQKKVHEVKIALPDFEALLKKAFQILTKYFILVKYQFFKRTQHANFNLRMRLPFQLNWFQLAFLAFAVYIVFKKDLSFSVNMKSPEALIIDRDEETGSHNNMASSFATAVSFRDNAAAAFVDAPNDNAETKAIKSYIRRFKDVAQTESRKFGIPASIKMAQALVESNAGRSGLSAKNKNHFGIKCFSKNCRKGHCSNFNDDHHKDFFRKYSSAWESWRAHSKFLANGRYKSLQKYGNDYRAWANGLKELGYATDPNYPEKLVKKIERYRLDLLD